jgi:hypothetical protein
MSPKVGLDVPLQVLYQIGIVGERMVTLGGAIFLAVKLPLKTEFSHEPSHPLAVTDQSYRFNWAVRHR